MSKWSVALVSSFAILGLVLAMAVLVKSIEVREHAADISDLVSQYVGRTFEDTGLKEEE